MTYQNYVPRQVGRPCEEEESEEPQMIGIPTPIYVASEFIEQCNRQMGPRIFTKPGRFDQGGEIEVAIAELHPSQEGAFRLACNLLGSYFSNVAKVNDKMFDKLSGEIHRAGTS